MNENTQKDSGASVSEEYDSTKDSAPVVLTRESMEAADKAWNAVIDLAREGGPLSKEAFETMRAGGVDVKWSFFGTKSPQRLAIDCLMRGWVEMARSYLDSYGGPSRESDERKAVRDQASVNVEKPESASQASPGPVVDEGNCEKPVKDKAVKSVSKPKPKPEQDDFRKSRIDMFKRVNGRLNGGGQPSVAEAPGFDDVEDVPEDSFEEKEGKPKAKAPKKPALPYPARAMGIEDAEKFLKGYASSHGYHETSRLDGVCPGLRMLLDGRAVIVVKLLDDGTVMVNRSGTRYHSFVQSSSLKCLYPAREENPCSPRSGDRVSVALCDEKDGRKTFSRSGVVTSVSKTGSVDVMLDDTKVISTFPSWCVTCP